MSTNYINNTSNQISVQIVLLRSINFLKQARMGIGQFVSGYYLALVTMEQIRVAPFMFQEEWDCASETFVADLQVASHLVLTLSRLSRCDDLLSHLITNISNFLLSVYLCYSSHLHYFHQACRFSKGR